MATKIFNLEDQRCFARASGDDNPIHVDPVAARRLPFGEPIVHGMHLLLWGLDTIAARRPLKSVGLDMVSASFKRPLTLGVTAEIIASEDQDDTGGFEVRAEGRTLATCRYRFISEPETHAPPADMNGQISCHDLTFAELNDRQGTFPLEADWAQTELLFPALAVRLNPTDLAALLAASRLVGMECPGRHSLFSSLAFERGNPFSPNFSYRCVLADERFQMIKMEVSMGLLKGEIAAFFRPPPVRQTDAEEIRAAIAARPRLGGVSLCIGGSRGLGEAAAKILAMAGSEVILTYRLGEEDAETVAAQIRHAGGRAQTLALDVTDPTALDKINTALSGAPVEHFCYFAAPMIEPSPKAGVSKHLADLYQQVFVTAFECIARGLAAAATSPLTIFYPSTAFLDAGSAKFREYCTAKKAGEILCRQLELDYSLVQCLTPRLPQILTDQTSRLNAAGMPTAATALLPYLPPEPPAAERIHAAC